MSHQAKKIQGSCMFVDFCSLGRAIVVIIGAIAEFERNVIIERVRARHAARQTRRPAYRPAADRCRS
jgi:DNA invertase Pin-like site-specific DNA recombinase